MLEPNTLLQHRYQIVRLVGQGGMGAVYEAIDQRLGNSVALKQMLVSGEIATQQAAPIRRAFEREARLLAGLRHPALPRVIDHFTDQAGQFLVMEFVPGDDLAAMLQRRGSSFPLADVLRWADQLLDALDYLHTQQPPIIHRDIKPQNLKLLPRGEVILLDFGLAKGMLALPSSTTTSQSIFGYTPQYAPLEQIQGAGTDPRGDLYALAATLYHLLTGVLPADALARAARVIAHQPDPLRPAHEVNPVIPPAISALLIQALALGPNERPASADAMRAALQAAGMPSPDPMAAPTVLTTSPQHIPHHDQTEIIPPERPLQPPSRRPTTPASVAKPPRPATAKRALLPGLLIGALVLLIGALGLRLFNRPTMLPLGQTGGPAPSAIQATARPEPTPPATPEPAADAIPPLPSAAPPTMVDTTVLPTILPTSAPTRVGVTPEPLPAVGQQGRTRANATRELRDQPSGGTRLNDRPLLYPGAELTVLALEPGAVQVRTPEGVEGWIQAPADEALTSDLTPRGDQVRFTAGAQVQVVLPNGIPLRDAPNPTATKLIERMPAGRQAQVQELRGDWLLIMLEGGQSGWARWYYDGQLYINTIASSSPPVPFTRILSMQEERLAGDDVAAVQQRLLALGYRMTGEPEGVFGLSAAAATQRFQQTNRLEPDGVVGARTWERLFSDVALPLPATSDGTIVGSLGFPSEGIPALLVYAINADDPQKVVAIRTDLNQSTFSIPNVAPGTYHVLAYLADPPDASLSGAYSQFVPCGLSVQCSDHSLIPVVVAAGQITGGVEVKDWFAPEGTFPPRPSVIPPPSAP